MNTPRYEYSRTRIQQTIDELIGLSAPFGLTVRYAIKANPHPEIIKMMHQAGVEFDASSSYEAQYLLDQGVPGSKIVLSSQQSAHNLDELLASGVGYVATSLNQLESFINAANRPDEVAVRINPGVGTGHINRVSTGGPSASFGIWHEYIEEVNKLCSYNNIIISTVTFHLGSGADPKSWEATVDNCLKVMNEFPDATTIDLGGGFKAHRYGDEQEADVNAIVTMMGGRLLQFEADTGRQLKLEIEPGTYFIVHAGTLVAQVDDIVDTGTNGYNFIRINTGMNDFLRSSMYGSRHKIEVMNEATETEEYVVVGHNCESGDILTPADGDPEGIETRILNKASIGDEVRIYDVGAYCASMRAKGYNLFPDAKEVFVD